MWYRLVHVEPSLLGLARRFGSPQQQYSPNVVSGPYRAPELLLGQPVYGPEVDVWAVGCIFGELLQRKVLFPGTNELDQLHKIFDIIGTPNDSTWPGYSELPAIRHGARSRWGGWGLDS